MAFALSGSTITQSGTDTDLAGIAGNGATLIDHGVYKVYDLGTNELVVSGTLNINTIDGIQEQLLVGTGSQSVIDLEVSGTGNLTIGLNSTNADGTYNDAIHFPSVVEKDTGLNFGTSRGKNDSWAGTVMPFMLVRAGGTFTWNGAMIACGGIAFDGNGNGATDTIIKLNNAIWDTRTVAEYGAFDQLIYSYTRDIEVNGLTVMAVNAQNIVAMFGQLDSPLFPIKGYTGAFTGAAFSGSTSQPIGFTLVIEDYEGVIGNNAADDMQPQGRTDTTTGDVTFRNSAKGSLISLSGQTDTIQIIKAEQTIIGNFKTGSGAAINDYIIGTVDVNNTLYSALGSAGNFDMGNIRLAQWDGGVGINPMIKTSYSPDGADGDLYDFYMYSYLYERRTRLQVLLRKIGGQNIEFIGTVDANITEVTRSTVDAYVVINSLDKLYDYSKSYKIDNMLLPSLSTTPITAQGNILDLGDLDLNIGITATLPYECTSTTITVKVK